jgi:predicted flap endonuclease-1-like 5' DNA nuclease
MLQREVTQALGAALLPPLQAQPSGGIPWWVWLLVILVIVVLAFIWLRGRAGTGQPEMREAAPERGEVPPDAGLVERPVASAQEMAAPAAPVADDLAMIEGIGPRIADLLRQNGITTFEQLAQADVTRLREILQAARLGALADPATWPEQARLAAAGDWDQFEALTQRLRGGRQVEA